MGIFLMAVLDGMGDDFFKMALDLARFGRNFRLLNWKP